MEQCKTTKAKIVSNLRKVDSKRKGMLPLQIEWIYRGQFVQYFKDITIIQLYSCNCKIYNTHLLPCRSNYQGAAKYKQKQAKIAAEEHVEQSKQGVEQRLVR